MCETLTSAPSYPVKVLDKWSSISLWLPTELILATECWCLAPFQVATGLF